MLAELVTSFTWKAKAGDDECDVLSDSRVIVRPSDGKGRKWFKLFGTPWAGPAGLAENTSAPLHAILFLSPGGRDRVVPLPLAAVESYLMPVVDVPWQDPEIAPLVADFCKRIMATVPAYEFQFRPRRRAVKFLRQFAATLH